MSSGSPAKISSSLGSRTANTRATDSARIRRATNASVWQRRDRATERRRRRRRAGPCSAASANSPSTARPTAYRSGAGPERKPKATSTASRCGSGSASSEPSIDPNNCCRPANGNYHVGLHARRPGHHCTPTTALIRYSSNAVLPIPASPRTTSAPLRPARMPVISWPICSCSRRRPRRSARGQPVGRRPNLAIPKPPAEPRLLQPWLIRPQGIVGARPEGIITHHGRNQGRAPANPRCCWGARHDGRCWRRPRRPRSPSARGPARCRSIATSLARTSLVAEALRSATRLTACCCSADPTHLPARDRLLAMFDHPRVLPIASGAASIGCPFVSARLDMSDGHPAVPVVVAHKDGMLRELAALLTEIGVPRSRAKSASRAHALGRPRSSTR